MALARSNTPLTRETGTPSQIHPSSAWEKFYADIAHLNESEYGDFKRKAGYYLNELAERSPKDPALRREIKELYEKLWLYPGPEINGMQNALLNWARSRMTSQR